MPGEKVLLCVHCRLQKEAQPSHPTVSTGREKHESKFVGENVLQPDFQLHQNSFQLVQSQVMFAMLNAKKRLVRYAGFFCEFRVGKSPPLFTQEFCQLFVQVASHNPESGKNTVTYA
jgi:hypothetical protein